MALFSVGALNAATVNARRENQQDRIAQGVRSGQLTAHETASLEGKEARLNHQIRNDRVDHSGHLTAGEHVRVNRGTESTEPGYLPGQAQRLSTVTAFRQ